MKKLLALVLSLVLVMTLFTGCSGGKTLKTGLGIVSSTETSKDAGDEDGTAQTDSTAAAVLVDDKGVIQKVVIDVIQTKINFSATGEITTDSAEQFISKHELGNDYNMKGASPIGKEWFEQANAFADYVVGKTLDEVKGISLEAGAPTDEDLKSSVTMNIEDFIIAIEKAVNNAKDLGASKDDKLGLGLISGLGHSSANAGDEDGTAQAYSHYGAITVDKGGKITSSIIDASQSDVKFSNEGKLTSVAGSSEYQSKLELGNDYNMKGASPIGKEWFEQSEAFSEYIKGKTVSDVTGIALNEGAPSDEDLASSVTITINDWLTVIEKAGATAK
jgi:hypothetical protein